MSIKERTNPYNDTRVGNPAIFENTPAAPVQEPVAWLDPEGDEYCNVITASWKRKMQAMSTRLEHEHAEKHTVPVYTTPPTAPPTTEESSAVKPAAPVQEPDHGDELTIAYMSGLHDGKKKREWVSLTADERYDIRASFRGRFLETSEFAEQVQLATEAKLKEKNT
jgi:hypothetical protein